jgi:uncharacterized membrane protein
MVVDGGVGRARRRRRRRARERQRATRRASERARSVVSTVADVARGRETRGERRSAATVWIGIFSLKTGIVFLIHRTTRARDEGAVDA